MAISRKVSELTAASEGTADDLIYLVNDPAGTPGSRKITVKNLRESPVVANLVSNGHLVVTQTAVANAVVVNYSSTPANATAVPAGFTNNTIWTDGSYIYVVTGTGALKRVAISSW